MDFPGGSEVKHLPAMQETWVRSLGREDPLEKEMATHSSTLAWRTPWTEESGGLQFMGSRKSRTGLVTEQAFTQTAVQMARLNYKAESMGFPCGSAGKESPCNVGDLGSIPGWEDPLEKGKATHSSILAWRIQGWGRKESDTRDF